MIRLARGLAVCASMAGAGSAEATSLWFQQNAPGAHDYGRQVVLPAGFGDAEFTLELWIRPDHTYPVGSTSGGPSQLVNWSDADNPPYGSSTWWYEGNFLLDGHNNASFEAGTFSLQFYGGGRVRWLFGDQGGAPAGNVWSVGAYPATSTPSLLDGGWHQLTLVRRWSGASSAQLEMWIDGGLVDTETSPARTNMRQWWDAWPGFPAGQAGWFWGAEKQAAIGVLSQYEDYKGLLDEIRFWSRAKTAAEIAAGWRDVVAPGATGLVGLFRVNEGAGAATCNALSAGQCVSLFDMKPGHWSPIGAPLGGTPPPVVAAGDCAVVEGPTGCVFTVSLTPASALAATVAYATAGGSAVSGLDFTAAAGTLSFAPGATVLTVAVGVLGDTLVEGDETFTLGLSAPAGATVGDAQGTGTILDDDGAGLAGRGLSPGGAVVDDLEGGPDLYRLTQHPHASYELVLDAASGDIGPGLALERIAADGSTVLQSGTPIGTGSAMSLRWENRLAAPVLTQYVRVRSGQCSTGCGADDVYRLRAYETTGGIARFNNGSGQVTVVLLQNLGPPLSGRLHFWDAAGQLVHAQPFGLAARGSLALNTASLAALQGRSGSLTVSHDGPYGALAGKAVALEPSAGFSFDSPLLPRAR